MEELIVFRKKNSLTQTELGNYLGVGKSFISCIERGASKLPSDKLARILANDKGWDVSMLHEEEPLISQHGKNNFIGDGNSVNEESHLSLEERQELVRLRAENELLRGQIDWLQNMVSKLTNK